MFLPRNCSALSISGRTTRFNTSVPTVVAMILTSPPPTAAPVVVPPEICTKDISPAISAFIPCTPLGVAITSTCKPCFLKMPDSWAAQGGAMEPEMEVMATRILRGDDTSPARAEEAVNDNQRTHIASGKRKGTIVEFPTSGSFWPEITDRIAASQIQSGVDTCR